ncbi:unnamed protein product [Clonostachys rosea]|uniref:BTB domain-containing protein n=1 Tax=Bionectria ochroleuca TaxID=29856 RepID=A0ABY6U533_BIOOC|nr:unnamed protein product [Clonostachys rosea]
MAPEPQISYDLSPRGDTLFVLKNPNAPFARRTKDAQGDVSEETAIHEAKSVTFRVSSQHLTLASRYFERMLLGTLSESTPKDNSYFVVEASEIIHGCSGQVPFELSDEDLAKMAVLVDFHQCHGVVRFFARLWMSKPQFEPKTVLGRDLALRLVAHCVFEPHNHLKIGLWCQNFSWLGTTLFDKHSLPINDDLIAKMNERRVKAIGNALDRLYSLLNELSDPAQYNAWCLSAECATQCLGKLTSQMITRGILVNRAERPYNSLSCANIMELIQSISIELARPRERAILRQICRGLFAVGFRRGWRESPGGSVTDDGIINARLEDALRQITGSASMAHVCTFNQVLQTIKSTMERDVYGVGSSDRT